MTLLEPIRHTTGSETGSKLNHPSSRGGWFYQCHYAESRLATDLFHAMSRVLVTY
jgi:hypothetical protein